MRTPWFMHNHKGRNTSVGVYGTPHGTYVRSNQNFETDVFYYPMAPAAREIKRLGLFPLTSGSRVLEVENQIDEAVAQHDAQMRSQS